MVPDVIIKANEGLNRKFWHKGQAPPPFRPEIYKIPTIMADTNGSQGVNSKNCPENLPYPQINKRYFLN